jgi:signal peptidase I
LTGEEKVPEPDERAATRRRRSPGKKSIARDYAEALLIAVIIAFLLRAFAVQAFKIPSGSMKLALLVGDYVVELVVHRRRVPRRDYVKRIIGLPGDVVTGKDGSVRVNGKPLGEPYVLGLAADEFGPFKVPAASYFVMGDSRADSRDSRHWGFVPRRLIRGRAVLVYWSWVPSYCPKHRSSVSRLYRARLAGAEGGGGPARGAYVCDACGEVLLDGEDVRLAKWYKFWRRVRWERILLRVR